MQATLQNQQVSQIQFKLRPFILLQAALLIVAFLTLAAMSAIIAPGTYSATTGNHTLSVEVGRYGDDGCRYMPTFISFSIKVPGQWNKLEECTKENLIAAIETLLTSWAGVNVIWFTLLVAIKFKFKPGRPRKK